MQLSKNVSLKDMIYSETAEQQNIENIPSEAVIDALKDLCEHILEPVFKQFGGVLDITSGYRCEALNALISDEEDSQHCLGEAVDFGIIDTDIYDIATWIKDNLEFDQLILEEYNPSNLNKGWVHCSYTKRYPNRGNIKTFDGSEYHEGLLNLPLRK